MRILVNRIEELEEAAIAEFEGLEDDEDLVLGPLVDANELEEVERTLELESILENGDPLPVELVEDDVPATGLLAANEVV